MRSQPLRKNKLAKLHKPYTWTFLEANSIMKMVMKIMWLANQSHCHPLFVFIEINFYSLSFFSDIMNICNDQMNYDEIIIQ